MTKKEQIIRDVDSAIKFINDNLSSKTLNKKSISEWKKDLQYFERQKVKLILEEKDIK